MPPARHETGRAGADPLPQQPFSLLRTGARNRLAGAALVCALIWLGVWWSS
jgi:hypothetical protein